MKYFFLLLALAALPAVSCQRIPPSVSIPGYGEMDWGAFLGELMETHYRGPVCIEVEDDTFGKTLAGRQEALIVAGNVLRPYFASSTN